MSDENVTGGETKSADQVTQETATTDSPEAVVNQEVKVKEPVKTGHTFDRSVEVDTTNKKIRPEQLANPVYGPAGYNSQKGIEVVVEAIEASTGENVTDKASKELAQSLYFGEGVTQADKMMDPALFDDERDFRQGVKHNGGTIGTRAPATDEEAEVLKGISAVHHVNMVLGLGGAIYQPLWSSGFQVTWTPPLLKKRHEFDFEASVLKERNGWLTGGFTFSASNIMSMATAIRFAMDHLAETTYPTKDPVEMLKAIDLTDVHVLLGSFAATIYPDGFPMVRGCPKCKTTYKSLISIPRLLLADNSKLSLEQREIISLTPGMKKRLTQEQLASYRQQHKWNTDLNRYEVEGYEVVFYFKVPTIYEALENSEKWAADIRNTLVESMGSEISDNQRNNFMADRAAKTILSQYSHWVQKIVVRGKTIEDPTAVSNSLGNILGHEAVKNAFVSCVRRFIRSATIGVVALPPHQCSTCKHIINDDEDSSLLPNTVALDPLELFFVLVTRSIQASLPE